MSSNSFKVFIFDEDDLTKTLIENYLKGDKFSYEVSKFGNFDKSFIKNDESVKFIFVDISRRNINILRDIYVLSSNEKNIFILMSSEVNTDLYVKSLRSGAKEFLRKPLQKNDFLTAIYNHYDNEVQAEAKKGMPKVISVTSRERGCGKTFFSINLARELAGITKERVLLLDFNDNLNNVSFSLDVDPAFDTKYFLKNVTAENGGVILPKASRYKNSSLYIITNGLYKSEEKSINKDNIINFLNIAKRYFKYIVVDVNQTMDILHEPLFNNTDIVFYIVTPSLTASVKNNQYIKSFFEKRAIKIVLNKYRAKDENKINDIETTLQRELFIKIPMNLMVTMGANSRGKTIREINPNLDIVKSYNKVAQYIINRA